MKHNAYCKALCKAKTYNMTDKRSASAYNRIRRSIVLEYVHHWYGDGLEDDCIFIHCVVIVLIVFFDLRDVVLM